MDKDKTGGSPPELEDILNEFAPLSGGGKTPPADEPPAGKQEKTPQKAPEKPSDKAPEKATPKVPDKAPEKTPDKARDKAPEEKAVRRAAPAEPPREKGEPSVFDTPPVEEPEEPTLRLLSKDGKLVRAVPVGREPRRKEPRRKEAPPPEEETAPEAPREERKLPWWRRKKEPVRVSEKVIQLPEEENELTRRLGQLFEKADAYAEGMFPDDKAPDPKEALREQLLPGVDYEEDPTHVPRPRRKRSGRPKPDTPPGTLAKKAGRGLGFLHTRVLLAFLWCLPQLYLMIAPGLGLPLPAAVAGDELLRCRAAAVGLAGSALLGLDVLGRGLKCLLQLRLESETLLLFAGAAAAADALTMSRFGDRGGAMPYCGVAALAIFFALWGRFLKRSALRQSCRVAASGSEPYLVTLDERMWNGQDAFVKRSGEVKGFGSQVQAPDGAQRAYHFAAPLILLACGLLALVASVGQKRPQLYLWSLSATLLAGCGFTAFLTFPMPYAAVTRRLAKIGGALGGWDGISFGKRGVGAVLTDGDLFPPGSVTLNGIKLVGDIPLDVLVSYAATLVRETGSGMEKPFQDLLRTQGAIYRRCSGVVFHEGGVSGVIAGRQVYVGSGAFMTLMDVAVPQGLNVKNAAFCAVDGVLEGIFALNYQLHTAVRPSLEAMIANGIKPILATRDFDIIPEMLRKKFKLPADRLEFPSLDRRRELSSRRQEHAPELAAVLCREGLGPYAEAVVGGKRLARSVRLGLFFDLLGAAAGVALAAYLTASAAFSALSAEALLVFLLLWMVPGVLVSGWANRY